MALRPEQERALDYVRRRGTESLLSDIRSRVAGTYAEFEALVDTVSADQARTRPEPSGWCVQEIVDHVSVSDRLALGQLTRFLAGETVEPPIPAGLQSAAPLELDWRDLVAGFREIHRSLLATLDALSDEVPLAGSIPVEMVVKCAGADGSLGPVHWVQSFDWKAFAILLSIHNREHIAQMQRTLASFEEER